MKLAEALQRRSDKQNKIEELRRRLINSAKYQEGEKPVEDPQDLLKELEDVVDGLEDLVYRINYTNSITQTSMGSLTKILAKRDALFHKRSVYETFANEASDLGDRYSKKEIKMVPSVDVSQMRKSIDRISKILRELDLLIQKTNWLTDLAERDQ